MPELPADPNDWAPGPGLVNPYGYVKIDALATRDLEKSLVDADFPMLRSTMSPPPPWNVVPVFFPSLGAIELWAQHGRHNIERLKQRRAWQRSKTIEHRAWVIGTGILLWLLLTSVLLAVYHATH